MRTYRGSSIVSSSSVPTSLASGAPPAAGQAGAARHRSGQSGGRCCYRCCKLPLLLPLCVYIYMYIWMML